NCLHAKSFWIETWPHHRPKLCTATSRGDMHGPEGVHTAPIYHMFDRTRTNNGSHQLAYLADPNACKILQCFLAHFSAPQPLSQCAFKTPNTAPLKKFVKSRQSCRTNNRHARRVLIEMRNNVIKKLSLYV